jgi:hypothetical protein
MLSLVSRGKYDTFLQKIKDHYWIMILLSGEFFSGELPQAHRGEIKQPIPYGVSDEAGREVMPKVSKDVDGRSKLMHFIIRASLRRNSSW